MLRVIPDGIPSGIGRGMPCRISEVGSQTASRSGDSRNSTTVDIWGLLFACGVSISNSIHRQGSRATGRDAWMAADAAIGGSQ